MDNSADIQTREQLIEWFRDSWPGRVLAAAAGRMAIVVPSILAHVMDDEFQVLIRCVQPPCWDDTRGSIRTPFICSTAKVSKRGRVIVKCMMRDYDVPHWQVIFDDTDDFVHELRKLADAVKLADSERIEFFAAARKWLPADMRIDPAMNPADPDAKRLRLN